MAQYLDAMVAPLLSEGCRRLSLPPAASVELLRFLKLKSWYDGLPAARRPCGMSPGAGVDRLWHFMLLNTRVSTAVHAALGVGAVEHVGTDEQDLSDDDKMMQRLLSMNMMAAEGWAPNTQLWEDPGTIMHQISTAPGAPLLKYTCPAIMTPAQLKMLEAHLQAVYAGDAPHSNGFAAEESNYLLNKVLNGGFEQQQPAQPQPAPPAIPTQPVTPPLQQQQLQSAQGTSTPAAQPTIKLTVLLHGAQGAVLSSLTVTTPANATVGSVKQCLSAVQDAEWQKGSVLFCAGVGVLADDAASISQLGICDNFVLRWCKQQPRFAAQPVKLDVADSWTTTNNLDGLLGPWMFVQELSQVIQLATTIPFKCQQLGLQTAEREEEPVQWDSASAKTADSQRRLDGLDLDWPAQPLTISVSHRHAPSLYVILPSQLGGAPVYMEVLPGHTVRHVIQLALRKAPASSLRPRQQNLAGSVRLFATQSRDELLPKSTVRELGFKEQRGVLLLMMPGAPRPELFQVFVKTLSGKTITVSVSMQSWVEELKCLIWAKSKSEGRSTCMRLIFAGRQLEDGKTLADYNIQREATLQQVLRLTGC